MPKVSTIIPTIGRVESLRALLESILTQSRRPEEVLVADGSGQEGIAALLAEPSWASEGLSIQHLRVNPPNAVRQRQAAIAASKGEFLFLLDDDIVLEPACLERMLALLEADGGLSAVTADFSNQAWSRPTTLWRWYLRWVHGVRDGEWQGRVIGPLLRFGYNPSPERPMPMEWLGAGNSLVRRSAYDAVGGFSDFFLHRCTINEDVDLGLKLGRVGGILLHPGARMAHHHAPGGRVGVDVVAEDDLYNRFQILRRTQGLARAMSSCLLLAYLALEGVSSVGAGIRMSSWSRCQAQCRGWWRGLIRLASGS